MQVVEVVIPFRNNDVFKGYPVGDLHLGTKHSSEKHIINQFNKIEKDPFSFWWGMGDKGDFITPSDPRWNFKSICDWVKPDNIAQCQEDMYIDMVQKASYAKISDSKMRKHIGEIWGNHEESIRKHSHVDVQSNICTSLKVADLGFTCMLHLVFRRIHDGKKVLFKGFITHGSGDASTKGGKLMKLKKIMDQADADFYCFPENTSIWLSDGTTVPIQDIKENQRLININGNGCQAVQLFSRPYSGKLIEIKVEGLPDPIRCTPEHPILVSKRGWVNASSLIIGEKVTVPAIQSVHCPPKRRYCSNIDQSKLARLIGLYLAEGHTTINPKSYQLTFAFSSKEENIANEVASLIRDIWNKDGQYMKHDNSLNYRVCGKEITKFFTNVGGRLSWKKKICEEVLNWDLDKLQTILLSWIEGDGFISDSTVHGYTTSPILARQMFQIAVKLNWHPWMNTRKATEGHRESYVIGFSSQYIGGSRTRKKTQKPYSTKRHYSWYKIQKIQEVDYSGFVYNIKTTGNHTYVAGGIGVHNCVGHMHDIIPYPKLYLTTNDQLHLEHKQAWGTITGTFLKTYAQDVDAGYGEMRNYDPVPIGCPVFVFDPTNKQVTLDTKG